MPSADDGMTIYEEIVNSIDSGTGDLAELTDRLSEADTSGQFLCSTVRFLAAVDRERYAGLIPGLMEKAIGKDRERRYIGQLLKALWGDDYAERANELMVSDDIFRRIFKRVFASGTFD